MIKRIVKRHRVSRRPTIFTALLAFAIIGLGVFLISGCGKEKKAGAEAQSVEVVETAQKDVPIYSEWVATLDGLVNATIKAQVQGYLIKQNYKEGDPVKKGQVLFEIDPRPFQAALEEAKGQLAQAEARWQTAKANLARIKPLAEQNAVSKKDLDDAIGFEESTKASVISAKAALDKAQLNLDWSKVTSLIDGIAGIAQAQVGNLVGPGQVEQLTTVSTVNPIKAYIQLSEQEYMRLAESRKPTEKKSLELILTDGTAWPQKGEFLVADRQVDVKTGTIKIAITFPNPKAILRPGQFGKVRAEMDIKKGAILIPQRAVTELQGNYQVAVVGPENKVDIRSVKAGERVGTLWIIDEGLKAGESVIVEGVQKVKQGSVVSPKPFQAEAKVKPETGSPSPAKPDASSKPEEKGSTPPKPTAPTKQDKR
jgi:membrane fusion protein (multidrug efflux system)